MVYEKIIKGEIQDGWERTLEKRLAVSKVPCLVAVQLLEYYNHTGVESFKVVVVVGGLLQSSRKLMIKYLIGPCNQHHHRGVITPKMY